MNFVLKHAGEKLSHPQFDRNVAALRQEINSFYADMQNFNQFEPAEIFMKLAAFTARASYLRNKIFELPENRLLTHFRIKQLDPFIEECDRQFRVWSRNFSVMAQEWQITKGV